MNSFRKHLVQAGCILCYLACIGDAVATYAFGRKYPGYSHLTGTISSLGATISPVGDLVSAWWVILGSAFVVFALGFNELYREKGNTVKLAAWLIALYGLGEGLGSGLFKADHIGNSLSTSGKIHDVLGGFGVAAVLVLPLAMRRIFREEEHAGFFVYSAVVFYAGIGLTLLFVSNHFTSHPISLYTGLWQRLTRVNWYLYFMVVAAMMLMHLRQRGAQPRLATPPSGETLNVKS